MDIRDFLDKYGFGKSQGIQFNQYNTKPTCYSFTPEETDTFNAIYNYLYKSDLNKLKRTASGAIAKGIPNRSNRYAWDIIKSNTGLRITVSVDGFVYVFKLGKVADKDESIEPSKAWKSFKKELLDDGIDIDSYAEEDGYKYKETIPNPLIEMKYDMNAEDDPLDNVHHIDFHNSYPAGLANTHPEFRPTIERLYLKRKESKVYKDILNYSVGCMQSMKHNWKGRWSRLASDAINDNYRRVVSLATKLQINGREIIGFNTDGIWYRGEVFHGEGEGDKLGEWHNDHVNCLFRSKSKGAYEFIEDGVYYPVVRGTTGLDTIKNREEWTWGDIFQENAQIIKFKFIEGQGVTYEA